MSRPLELLHLDLFGPSHYDSLGGSKYGLVIVDDYSRYYWVFLLKSKDETHREFIIFTKKAQRMYESEIKAIRTDNDTEFKNYTMQEFVDDEGIKHEFSAPYTPQQNGVVERKNRTIIETARTMLSEFNSPHKFWGEAISTVVHYSNRLFLRPLHNKTPYDLFTGNHNDPSSAIKLMGIGHIRPIEVHNDDQDDGIEMSHIPKNKKKALNPLSKTMMMIKKHPQLMFKLKLSLMINFEPLKVHEALVDPDWVIAMQEELECFTRNEVWSLVERPKDHRINVIGTKWVFKNKQDENGIVIRNKARLVAQGFAQIEGMDFEDTFAPVARLEAIRLLLAFAYFHNFKLYQMDVKSAFLNGPLKENMWLNPRVSKTHADPTTCIYSIRHSTVSSKLHVLGMSSLGISYYMMGFAWVRSIPPFSPNGLKGVAYLYVKYMLMILYLVELTPNQMMTRKFEMSMMGELKFFLGFQVRQLAKGTFISQEKYVKDMLKKFNMTNASPMKTPMPIKGQLGSCDGEKDVDIKKTIDGCDLLYCELRRSVRERMTPNYAQYIQLLINKVVPAPDKKKDQTVKMEAFKMPSQGDKPEIPAMMPSERRSKERHDPARSSYSRRPKRGASRFLTSLWQMCKNTNDVAHQSLALNQETRRRQNDFMAARNTHVPPPGPEMEPVYAPTWEMPPIDDEMLQNFDLSMYTHGGLPPRSARDPDTTGYGEDDDDGNEQYDDEDDDEEGDDDDVGDDSSPAAGTEFY
ncbi:hypothetical protein QYE76_040512 [Lolium multiflorum]|uniref:Integrase catalytic domain-containing protein n=1 Tax=Lolium multiflorum TaxID=4521 RepID=A0AAD8TD67_LOLMU|nr:hypothetical protein QYE76_040512 [Lolium multiflorum]